MQPPQDRTNRAPVEDCATLAAVSARTFQTIRTALARMFGEDSAEEYALPDDSRPQSREARNSALFGAAGHLARHRRPPERDAP